MKEFIEITASKQSLTNRKLSFGVGVNDADYLVQPRILGKHLRCPYYGVWIEMLRRCYCIKYQTKQPTYIGCIVSQEWLVFSNFKAWMQKQDWKEKCLDKDILVVNNKEYSSENCIFVTQAINSLLNKHYATRGHCKLGVSFDTNSGKYKAYCNNKGKIFHLGLFITEQEAHDVYCAYKANLIKEIAEEQTDLRLKNALIERANTIHLVE